MGIRRVIRQFLGLDKWRPVVVGRDRRSSLKLNYLTFKDLITSNDEILEIIADVEQKLEGGTYFGMHYIRSRCVMATTHAFRMVANLNKLSSRRYPNLQRSFAGIRRALEAVVEPAGTADERTGPLVFDLGEVDRSMDEQVGGKSANLGEVRNRARLPVPDGFAVTMDAFRTFLSRGQLREEIRSQMINVDLDDLGSLTRVSENIREAVLGAPVPADVEEALVEGYRRLSGRLGYSPRVSVRSSAMGEDNVISFAGQYVSVLNVTRQRLLLAYKEVVAGLYTPRAIFYRNVHGIPDEDVPMAAVCMAMVDAAVSGVACSLDPNRPGDPVLIVNGAWGLGVGTVSGSVSPDTWVLSKEGDLPVLRAGLGAKQTTVEPSGEGGTRSVPVTPELAGTFCLTESQVRDLAYLVLAAEKHFGKPQELEWVLDRGGKLYILQCRPLHIGPPATEPREEAPESLDGHPLLVSGVPASGGCRSGPVHVLDDLDDLGFFPEGAVLVARHSSPQFVKVMGRAAAIVTDIGAPTGHMASLAREFGVPAVLDARDATARLKEGAVVTVDADRGAVYSGRIERLLARSPAQSPRTMKGTPLYATLEAAGRHILPLNLTDPRSRDFRPEACRTLHDVARFAHEKAFEEMFRMSDRVTDLDYRALRLLEKLPFEVYMIDLGGGLSKRRRGEQVRTEDVSSEPMKALLAGMTRPDLKWWEPKPISVKGFLSVARQSLFTPYHQYGERRLGDRSYAIVADAYCNFSSRIGYHFTAVDAYASATLNRNYISFRFKGGAADDQRRARRCLLIGKILRALDFQIEGTGDLVNARLRKYGRETILGRLDQIGRLIVATRQLDMQMGPDTPLDWYVDAFFSGNYLFDPGTTLPDGGAQGVPP